ncbi:hypothetical protein V6N13_091859 [Hibiscus sabdariffa]
MKRLGDSGFFTGDHISLSRLASDVLGCQPSCIYFTDDHLDVRWCSWGRHFGVCKMETVSFMPFYAVDDARLAEIARQASNFDCSILYA